MVEKTPETGYGNNTSKGESFFNINNRRWLTTKEVAEYLGRSIDAIHMLVSRGQLRSRKYLGKLYFDREEIDYQLETSKFKGG
ncbi:MAG: hypothetical protein CME70_04475 [Halobacteriovorax sp.]|nr:hypothetical protein [Halobacteriovorax sp.]